MKNLKFSRLFAALMFVAVLGLTGCKPEPEEVFIEVSIYGTWTDNYAEYDAYDGYDCKISVDFIETASYGKHTGPVYITKTSENSGYIYYQFSDDITGYDASFNPITVNAKGKWCAVAYTDLTANSVKMNDVYDPAYDFPSTLDDCISKYTIEKGSFGSTFTPFKKL